MCGIAGIVDSRAGARVDQFTIHRMCEAIVHRGPDDEGIFVKDGSGLGMRRLRVIDLAGGDQPIFNEDRTVWVVFNGEIYNFPELRRELENRGHRFSTHSDTEVIVHLYEDMGAECVQKLRGMFAFAVYDDRRRRLLMARDRVGKKPLHYALANGRLLFASEIKAILTVAPELATVNPEAVLQYFYFGYIPDPGTAFSSIHKLPPGHLMEFESGKISIRKYWDFPRYGTNSPANEEECLRELEHQLEEAVRIRMIADVPLGAMLSGGTDSSTVVALMARSSSRPVKTFAIGFQQADFNEAPFARIVSERFGTEHHELILEPNVVETVEKLTSCMEEPFGDSSMLPTYFISCLARQNVTVVLSGDGGDEAFAGYERYRIHLQDRSHGYGWIPPWAGRLYRKQIHPLVPRNVPGRSLAYSISLPWQDRYTEGVSFQPFQRQMQVLSADFLGSSEPLRPFRVLLDEAPADDPLGRVLYLDSKTYLPGDILTKVDRMSMLTSLEVRVPMLDHVFLEWVTGLTSEWKMRGTDQKYILKKLAERVGVPRKVLHRPKQGFSLPLVHWIRHELKDLILTVMLEPRTLQRGYFNPAGIRSLLDEHFQERRDHSARIWRLLMFELWQRNFMEALQVSNLQPPEPVFALRERSV
ncbi:MAG: asparagine synthase (glutamine-hydrolyzing) [Terriglobales bacterium]